MNYEEIEAARNAPERMERMKPILDRIPEQWGKYLPGPGWDRILLDLDFLIAGIDPDYRVLQAKEKFGDLRYYVQTSEHLSRAEVTKIHYHIEVAEVQSAHTCEWCGAAGKARHTGWIKTLCDDCAERRNATA